MNNKSVIHDNPLPLAKLRIRGRGRRAFWTIILIGAAAALASYMSGCSEHSRYQRAIFTDHGPHGTHEKLEWVLTQLNVTEEQRRTIAPLLKGFDSDVLRWQEERQALRDRLVQALQAEVVDQNDIATIKSDGIQLVDQALSRTMEATIKVSEVLTPHQRKELVAKWRNYR